MDKLMAEYTQRYGEETALKICLGLLDMPFYAATYKNVILNNSIFNIGLYIRLLNGRQYQYKCFLNSIVENELTKTDDEVKQEIEEKWSKSDKQNMHFAISIVGYDPFDNCGMTDNDRKYCFNILAGYCDIEGIQDDGHKIQSVVQITQSQLQCRKIDEMINEELLSQHADENKIRQLTATKTQLLNSITQIAKDNNLSSNYNEKSQIGRNTLSAKMKELAKNGYEDIKVNLFDIDTSNAMRQIADLSNQSIMKQLNFDANEYTDMLKSQRELLNKYQDKSGQLEEENRKLKNQLALINANKKR